MEQIKDISKVLYLPNEKIEEGCFPLNENCAELKNFLKSNAKIKTKSNTKRISNVNDISKVIYQDVNNHGNFAFLEITKEKADCIGLGTTKVLTPLKKNIDNEQSVTKKQGYFLKNSF